MCDCISLFLFLKKFPSVLQWVVTTNIINQGGKSYLKKSVIGQDVLKGR